MSLVKILITGAHGMLGHALADAFADQQPRLLGRADLDVTNPEQIADLLDRERPTVVINAAAYTNVDGCETDHQTCFAVNGTAVGFLAKACAARDIILVHYSTDYVFAGDNPAGYAEDAKPLQPISAYGESKADGERQLEKAGGKYYLVRTQWLYGAHGKNFVDTMLELGKKGSVRVVNDQFGAPTSTKTAAAATRQLLDHHLSFGIYHVVCSGQASWCDFAQEIFRRAGMTVNVQPVTTAEFPRPAKRPAHAVLLNTKLPPLQFWPDALQAYLNEKLQ